MWNHSIPGFAAVLVVSVLMAGCAQAPGNGPPEDAADFYRGKTITILVPASPGGTFDLISRTEAPYLEKYTGARTLLQNSKVILAQNTLYRSRPDGLTVILCGHGPKEITAQLFRQQGASFDWTKFTILGRIPASSTAFVVTRQSGWKAPGDLQGKIFLAGASSPFFEPLFAEALGWDRMSIIPGMTGSERSLAMRRGELQATSAGAGQFLQDKDLLVALVVTRPNSKGFPGIPSVRDAAIEGKAKWGRLASAWDELLYWSYATPGIPQDRAAFLEDALRRTFNDPDFVAQMTKLNIDLSDHFVDARELREKTGEIAGLSDAEIMEMEFVITRKYQKR